MKLVRSIPHVKHISNNHKHAINTSGHLERVLLKKIIADIHVSVRGVHVPRHATSSAQEQQVEASLCGGQSIRRLHTMLLHLKEGAKRNTRKLLRKWHWMENWRDILEIEWDIDGYRPSLWPVGVSKHGDFTHSKWPFSWVHGWERVDLRVHNFQANTNHKRKSPPVSNSIWFWDVPAWQ